MTPFHQTAKFVIDHNKTYFKLTTLIETILKYLFLTIFRTQTNPKVKDIQMSQLVFSKHAALLDTTPQTGTFEITLL